tara:strand:- start:7090 stop:7419 length:330 start_codon:yes stop_codon:yes gene_type:complete
MYKTMEALSFTDFDFSPLDIQDYPNFKQYINLDDYNKFKQFLFDKYIIKRSNDLNEQLKRNALERLTFLGIVKNNLHLGCFFYKLKYFPCIKEATVDEDREADDDYEMV